MPLTFASVKGYNIQMKIKEKYKRTLCERAGFTLLELTIVIVILGLLAALVGPKVLRNVDKGNQAAAKAQIELFGQGLDAYRLDVGTYPTTSEGLEALVTDPGIDGWDGPYLKKIKIPLDPWKRAYVYQSPGSHSDYDLFSYGKDGAVGGTKYDADIVSWE